MSSSQLGRTGRSSCPMGKKPLPSYACTGHGLRSRLMEDSSEVAMLLAQLMQPDTDLSSWSDEQVVKAARARKTATKTVERRTATELHRRGWTWEQRSEEHTSELQSRENLV